jgi:hypothetical protein
MVLWLAARMIFGAPLWMGVFMGMMTSLANSRAAMVGAWIAAAAAVGAGGIASTTPAYAQEVKPTAAVALVDPAIAREVDARLKALSPIIRGAEAERERLNVPVAARDMCSAQTGLYVKSMLEMKRDTVFSRLIASVEMVDLENMTKFATCTLPGGLEAKLNVCSSEGMLLTGALMGNTFDPKGLDARPHEVRCPGRGPVVVSSLTNG